MEKNILTNLVTIPSWNNKEDITIDSKGKTMSKSGWLIVRQTDTIAKYSLYVNDIQIAYIVGEYGVNHASDTITIPVNKGDVVKSSSKSWTGYFLPFVNS